MVNWITCFSQYAENKNEKKKGEGGVLKEDFDSIIIGRILPEQYIWYCHFASSLSAAKWSPP